MCPEWWRSSVLETNDRQRDDASKHRTEMMILLLDM